MQWVKCQMLKKLFSHFMFSWTLCTSASSREILLCHVKEKIWIKLTKHTYLYVCLVMMCVECPVYNANITFYSLFALNGCLQVSECPLQANSAALWQWLYFSVKWNPIIVSRCFICSVVSHSLLHVQTEGQFVCALSQTSFVSA